MYFMSRASHRTSNVGSKEYRCSYAGCSRVYYQHCSLINHEVGKHGRKRQQRESLPVLIPFNPQASRSSQAIGNDNNQTPLGDNRTQQDSNNDNRSRGENMPPPESDSLSQSSNAIHPGSGAESSPTSTNGAPLGSPSQP